MYFGHHGEQNQWQKLEKVKNEQSYMETEEHKDGVKQMVFSYKKFLHSAKVYETWLSNGEWVLGLFLQLPHQSVEIHFSNHKGYLFLVILHLSLHINQRKCKIIALKLLAI